MIRFISILAISIWLAQKPVKGQNTMLSSTSGVTRISLNRLATTPNFNDVIWADDRYLIVGDNYSCVLSSENGQHWSLNVHAFLMMIQPQAILWFSDEYLVFGRTGLVSSQDTREWFFLGNPNFRLSVPSYLSSPIGVACSDKRCVLVASKIIFNMLKFEAMWYQVFSGNDELHDVCWTGQYFIAVGENGTVLTSLDGYGWKKNEAITESSLFSIAKYNNLKIAVGENGTILYKKKTSWKKAQSGSGNTLLGVAVSEKCAVAVGVGGIILFSKNGKSWRPAESENSWTLNSVVWSEKMGFVAVGDKGTILHSKDGMKWDTQSFGQTDFWFVKGKIEN